MDEGFDVEAEARRGDGQSRRGEVGLRAGGVFGAAEAARCREGEGHDHAHRDRLAMEQALGEAGFSLERVAEGVTEVEERAAAARLALVLRDDRRLHAATVRDGMDLRGAVSGKERGAVALAPREEIRVAEQAVFHDLCIAGAHFAGAERIEKFGIDEHARRLVEGADEVLARCSIDRRLAADRRIDLREQRRRDLHEFAAAPRDGSGKAGEIADDAAAERDNRITPFHACGKNALDERFERPPILGRLACREDHGIDRAGERGGQLFKMRGRDGFIGNDELGPTAFGQPDLAPRIGKDARRNDDIVGARAKLHPYHFFHADSPRRRSSATMASTAI